MKLHTARLGPLLAGAASVVFAANCDEFLRRGQQAFDARNFAAAAAEFERASASCANRAPILVSLALVQYLLGRLADAEASLKAAVRTDPLYVPALYALGRVYFQQDRPTEAAEQFTNVAELDPKH